MKINLVVNKLPNFKCMPNTSEQVAAPQHMGTIHFEDSMEVIDTAFKQAYDGLAANPPSIEMTIPSSTDSTLAKPGYHIVQLFIQYAPYEAHGIAVKDGKDALPLKIDQSKNMWSNPEVKETYKNVVFDRIEEYAPGFKKSIVHEDVLTPWDLE
jgi:phytoene dehydrogenase-like protein